MFLTVAGKAICSLIYLSNNVRYDVESFQRIEHTLQRKLEEFPLAGGKDSVVLLQERVSEAVRMALIQMKDESQDRRLKKRGRSDEGGEDGENGGDVGDDEEARNASLSFKKAKTGRRNGDGQKYKGKGGRKFK